MADRDAVDFYGTYARFKDYAVPRLQAKHVARFDREFWEPTACTPDKAVLEVGCGTGLFLAYLREKGVTDFLGIDRDPAVADHLPPGIAGNFRAIDVEAFLAGGADGRRFDRVALFDVLEHFTPEDGVRLLRSLASVLNPDARLLIKVPNMASPWGGQFQYGDLTHKAAYNPTSMRQLAEAAGYQCTHVLPHLLGSPTRQVLDRLVHGTLGRLLMTPPEIWSANFFAVLRTRPG